MNKVDTIKLRVTPDFKARVVREAAHRGLSISKLVAIALEGEMTRAGRPRGQTLKIPDTVYADPWVSGGHEKFEVPVHNVSTHTRLNKGAQVTYTYFPDECAL